jgi:hypothetical protein
MPMIDPTTALFVLAVFVAAGAVKGVIGLGLQVLPMGLLVLVMAPREAAALLVVPAVLTNVWQAFGGPALRPLTWRLWPLLVGICLGTWLAGWAGAGLSGNGGPAAQATATLLIAGCLIVYAGLGLTRYRPQVGPRQEGWASPVVGATTGAITAATGLSTVPVVPFLTALALEPDELVQAMGLAFLVSTLAFAVNLHHAGALRVDMAALSLAAIPAAVAGMGMGQWLRGRIEPETFRRCFYIGLLALGVHLAVTGLR